MKIGMLFEGQGSQEIGMGLEFYTEYKEAKILYDEFPEIRDLCFYGPKYALDDTQYSQAAILLTSSVISSLLKQHIEVSYLAGLSLGEYSALVYSEVFSLKDAISIVKQRGKIMADALSSQSSMMAAVLGSDKETVLNVCEETDGLCEIANYNCPGQTVISLSNYLFEDVSKRLMDLGARRIIPLNVSGAFHSSLLKHASKQLKETLDTFQINEAKIPVIANYDAKEYGADVIERLQTQMYSSVMFQQSIEYMIEQGVDCFIEISLKKTMSGFVKRINKGVDVYSVSTLSELKNVLEVLAYEQ